MEGQVARHSATCYCAGEYPPHLLCLLISSIHFYLIYNIELSTYYIKVKFIKLKFHIIAISTCQIYE